MNPVPWFALISVGLGIALALFLLIRFIEKEDEE